MYNHFGRIRSRESRRLLTARDIDVVAILAPPLKKSKSRWVILCLHRQHLKRSQEAKDTVEVYHTAGFFDAASFL
jgi:hypothetical protein